MSFSNISGHTKEISILRNSILGNRLAHSLLFAGPEGIGKRLVALEVAKALNCHRGGSDACGQCADCEQIDAQTHRNVIQIWPINKDDEPDPNGLIKIEQIRDIQNSIKFRVERGSKVVIVNAADRMMAGAANAFLKTLEEPPAGSIIILISSRSADFLPTILSRCQRITFRPLPDEIVSGYLVDKRGIAPEDAASVARLSGGSISRAIKFMDEGANEKRREILERLTRLTPRDTDDVLKFAEELSKRDDLDEVLEFLKSWMRDRLVSNEGAGELIVNSDMGSYMGKGSREFRHLWDSFMMIENAKRGIMPPRYGNKQLAMETLLLRIVGCGI
ncbi:MAG: DNA polymerase III subunit delta' [Deltaproteobacteria bacterium]|nr:DNA polymerase III subunit delta' [Deltaproteobacteria bacterium]